MKKSSPIAQKRFFSVREAAVYTGLSARLIYQRLSERAMRSYRVGTRIVLDRKDLDTFVMASVVMSSDELREVLKEKLSGKKKKAGRNSGATPANDVKHAKV